MNNLDPFSNLLLYRALTMAPLPSIEISFRPLQPIRWALAIVRGISTYVISRLTTKPTLPDQESECAMSREWTCLVCCGTCATAE